MELIYNGVGRTLTISTRSHMQENKIMIAGMGNSLRIVGQWDPVYPKPYRPLPLLLVTF